jgi:hypothetical protein
MADEAVIQISIPNDGGAFGYSFTSSLGNEETVLLPVPPAGRDAELTVVMLGDGLKPSVAFRISADDFHESLRAGTTERLMVSAVQLSDAEVHQTRTAPRASAQSGFVWVILGGAGVLGSILLGVVLLRKFGGGAS